MYPIVYYQFKKIVKIAKSNLVKKPEHREYFETLIAELESACLDIEIQADVVGDFGPEIETETEEELLALIKTA